MFLYPILILAGGIIAKQIYKRYTTVQQKSKWEEFIHVYQRETGLIMTGAGVLTRSPGLVISGISMSLHHRKERGKKSPLRLQ